MITILAVGRLKGPYKELEQEFLKRLGRLVKIIEIREGGKLLESREILRRLKNLEGKVILCDVRGRQIRDDFFDRILSQDVVFIIGGSDGVTDEVKKASDDVVSLSPLTFNHQLFRIMLLEQIYRAYARVKGLPYVKH